MKTILFFRHGKSDRDGEYATDAERPLKKRGRRAARRMGRLLSEAGQAPELVLTSHAERARATALIAAEEGNWSASIFEVPSLYEATPEGLLAQIRSERDEISCLMLVGHEPAWSETIGQLIGQAAICFPTGAIARVDVEVPRWVEVEFGRGRLAWLVAPRLLEKPDDEVE